MNLLPDSPKDNIDACLVEALDSFRQAPQRAPEAAQAGRSAFLAQARCMAPPPSAARRVWLGLFPRVVWTPLYRMVIVVLLAVVLLLGGSGAVAYAAQDSLPGQALYDLKLSTEELRMAFTSESARLDLALEYTSRRVAEIESLAFQDQALAHEMLAPLQTSLEQSLNLAAAVPDDADLRQTLQRIEAHTRLQIQVVERIDALVENGAASELDQARQMLQRHLRWVEEGQVAPQGFRRQAPAWFPETPGGNWPPVPGPTVTVPPSAVPSLDIPAVTLSPSATHLPGPRYTPGSGGPGMGMPGLNRPTDFPGQGGPGSGGTGEADGGKGGPGGPAATPTPDSTPDGEDTPPDEAPGSGNGAPGGSSAAPSPGAGGGAGGGNGAPGGSGGSRP